ncbi:Guanine nucleotide-binding protein-like 3-like [Holothuria leucospilota]|uniref:Guanine nucleotide-binding protein-like 3-like n=1 Tax=Holothuria leucospilota TaxID=206669 RepID=A0A9Q1HJE8_HOLLE|nr:Guanine nucleotide-binding protein-like 3-like [Holothuria leucospilota]
MVKKGRPRKMKSKRLTLSKKYKIQKKVKEHKRKTRKEAKKNPLRKGKKDPGIPNIAPFKEAILREAEERKMKLAEEKQNQKANKKKMSPLERMRRNAEKKQQMFQSKKGKSGVDASAGSKDLISSRKAYFKEVKKVVDAADVLIEVLDARDPLGTRCIELEKEIMSSGGQKKLVLLLNKIDLVPRPVVEKWLKYLRNELPTIAFKASTQTQSKNLSQFKYSLEATPDHVLYTRQCLGATALVKLLNNYCRSADIKTSISVGVVGFPNVGKSSVINSLKRKKACSVGDTPGVTKSMQEVVMAKNIKLLDCPGVVLAKTNNEVTMVLRNCVKMDTISDPVAPIDAILKKCNREQLMLLYKLPQFSTTEEFLGLMAQKKGQFKKKGLPNITHTAKLVLQDWNSGKIPYFTSPPEEHSMPAHISAEIVPKFSSGFKLSTVVKQDETILKDVSLTGPGVAVEMNSTDRIRGVGTEEELDMKVSEDEEKVLETEEGEEDDEMEDEEEDDEDEDDEEEEMEGDENEERQDEEGQELEKLMVDLPTSEQSPAEEAKARGRVLKQLVEAKANQKATRVPVGNQQLGKAQKQAFKKVLKKRRRADKLATNLSEDLTKAMSALGKSGDDSYSFDTIFQ